jgi:hypothetical protein
MENAFLPREGGGNEEIWVCAWLVVASLFESWLCLFCVVEELVFLVVGWGG